MCGSRSASDWRVESGRSIAMKRRLGIKKENVQRSTFNVQLQFNPTAIAVPAKRFSFWFRCCAQSLCQPSGSANRESNGELRSRLSIYCLPHRQLREEADLQISSGNR